MKAVPTSYASDLHELKGVYMRASDESLACLQIFPHFIEGLAINKGKAQALLMTGHLLATEIADALTSAGLPFRDAYKKIAALVEEAEAQGLQVHEIASSKLPELNGMQFTFEKAVEARSQTGGTARARVLEQIAQLSQK